MIIIHTSMRVDNNLHLHIAAYLIVSFDYYEIDIDKLLSMLNDIIKLSMPLMLRFTQLIEKVRILGEVFRTFNKLLLSLEVQNF